MALLSRRRSFAEAVEGRRKLARRFAAVFAIFLSFEFVSTLFVSAFSAGSASMAPTILPGDRLLATPLAYGPRTLFGRLPGVSKPERGDLAIVDLPFAPERGFWARIADALVRFFTFQLLSIDGSRTDRTLSGPALQRVIGLPGDTVEMRNFVFMVRTSGSGAALTEFELSGNEYDIAIDDLPDRWTPALPSSGDMASVTLGENEYFVVGDARNLSGDSRLWGPIGLESFRSRVFLRYWPLERIGAP